MVGVKAVKREEDKTGASFESRNEGDLLNRFSGMTRMAEALQKEKAKSSLSFIQSPAV
jgi:hypothetical protein